MPSHALEVHFLDVGPEKYGDSILIRHDDQTILIDGGHPGDLNDRDGYPSIPTQLGQILGGTAPYKFSLLVVTHAHNDHIGCLPELVAQGIVTAERAYVADVALGWGQQNHDDLPDARMTRVLAVLREGAGATLQADNPTQAIADAVQLKRRYSEMLQKLADDGAVVIACTGDEDRTAIEAVFAPISLKVLGPTKEHLRLCADQLARLQRDAITAMQSALNRDAALADANLLGAVLDAQGDADINFLPDMYGEGSALNSQSIILALEFAGKKVLLAGDMQFASTEVDGLDAEMSDLRRVIQQAGPFHLTKTTHHTSYNGVDQSVIDEQVPGNEPFFLVHTGGVNDSHHPEANVLSLLRTLRRNRPDFTWLRTDRNGLISFSIAADGTITQSKAKGRVNSFQANTDEPLAVILPQPQASPIPPTENPRLEPVGGDVVEVVTRVPHTKTKVTVTIEVEPDSGASAGQSKKNRPAPPLGPVPPDPSPVTFRLPADRVLPRLLFITDEQALGRKIGAASARAAVQAINAGGQRVIADQRLAGLSAVAAADLIRPHLNGADGVVLVGGGDVVPALRLDVLGPDLRGQVASPEDDPDDFIVWNDEIYGDADGDHMGEIPVSRLADGGSAEALAAALGARQHGAGSRFGIRNAARPFANAVFSALPGNQPLHPSEPLRGADVRPRDVQADILYFMLHGDDGDTRRFWGEANGSVLEAFTTDQIPPRFAGVVFSGCCWGALTTTRRALHFQPGEAAVCRTSRDSIALRFLSVGAQAFVGCTGVHYSPPGNEPTSAGGPMHRAFFERLLSGEAPARALFLAKQDCFQALDNGAAPEEIAISLKIIRQFTCLGLGW